MRMRPLWTVIVLTAAGAILAAQVPDPRPAEVRNFRPVTEEMLRNPGPGDWPNWRRTDNAWGYSPLTSIDTNNVKSLTLAWSWSMTGGANEATPLVSNGIMYLPNPGGVVQALDAATGDLIWEYRPEPPAGSAQSSGEAGGAQRNIAIFGDKVFSATGDAHLVALDARTGKVAWDVTVAEKRLGYRYPPALSSSAARSSRASRAAPVTRTMSASSPDTTPRRARRSGVRRASRVRASRAGTRGVICRCSSAPAATCGSPAATIPRPTSSTGAPPRPSRGLVRREAPMALRSTRVRRWPSIPTPGKSSGTTSTSRRNARHGRGVRAHSRRRRRTQVDVHDGQAGPAVAAGPSDRRLHQRA